MAILSWGANSIKVTPITGTGATAEERTFNKNVESSTELTTTQGDKTEAKIEGGVLEAVRYAKNTYELTWQERAKADSYTPMSNNDGVVKGEFKLVLTPEDSTAPGLKMERCSLNVQISYTSSDGILVTYTATALQPTSGNQIEITAGTTGES